MFKSIMKRMGMGLLRTLFEIINIFILNFLCCSRVIQPRKSRIRELLYLKSRGMASKAHVSDSFAPVSKPSDCEKNQKLKGFVNCSEQSRKNIIKVIKSISSPVHMNFFSFFLFPFF